MWKVSDHAADEMDEDGILPADVLNGVQSAVVVEDYPTFAKGPCVLVLQSDGARKALHVVWRNSRGSDSAGRCRDRIPPGPRSMVRGFSAETAMTSPTSPTSPASRKRIKRVHEGEYVAEIEVSLTDFNQPWGPYLENEDVMKLDSVRRALRSGDVRQAAQYGRVFRLIPVPAA